MFCYGFKLFLNNDFITEYRCKASVTCVILNQSVFRTMLYCSIAFNLVHPSYLCYVDIDIHSFTCTMAK